MSPYRRFATVPKLVLPAILLALGPLALFPAAVGADTVRELPVSVPSIREWRSGSGVFTLGPGARIVASAGTEAVAVRFAEDLTAAGRATPVASGPSRPGEVVLRIDPSGPSENESYRIDVDDVVTVTARTDRGAMHATRTLLQWFRQSTTLPKGAVTDWPDYAERGLMLDLGRKYMSVGFIKQRIREMADFRMNLLHLHLSDTNGFRLQSYSHPEITAAQHYSRAEIADIVSYAAGYGITVVPEIGMPAHMNGILDAHEHLTLRPISTSPLDAATDQVMPGSSEGKLDISLPAARQLVEDLLREFVPLFPGEYFHIGGDEYVRDFTRFPQLTDYARTSLGPEFDGADAVAAFFNWSNGIVRSFGKTARMWNDGIPRGARIPVDTSILVEHWTSGDGLFPWIGNQHGPERIVDDGHRIMNSGFTPTYWTSSDNARFVNAPPEALYAWDPGLFVNGTRLRADQRQALSGSKLHIWCDDPTSMSEEELVPAIQARLPIMAQQLWSGTNGLLTYAAFVEEVRTVQATAP